MNRNGKPTGRHKGVGQMLRALTARNDRLFFFGQGVSLIGTWMQSVPMNWLVNQLTASEFLLGVVSFFLGHEKSRVDDPKARWLLGSSHHEERCR